MYEYVKTTLTLTWIGWFVIIPDRKLWFLTHKGAAKWIKDNTYLVEDKNA